MHGGVGSDRDNNEWKPVLPSLSFPKFKHTFISLWPALQRTESKSCVSFGSSNPFKFGKRPDFVRFFSSEPFPYWDFPI